MKDAGTIIINLMKEQGRVCDDCASPDIQVVSTPWQIPEDGDDEEEEEPPFAPGEYVQKCYCGSCFLKRVQKPKH